MKGILKLENPILVDGKSVSEVSYDTNEITAALFAEADMKRRMAAGTKNVSIIPAAEFDFALHLYLGFSAIVAVNPSCSFEDMARIHGSDIIEVMDIGRNFILKSDASRQSNSDEQSGTTAEHSTQAQQTSNENE